MAKTEPETTDVPKASLRERILAKAAQRKIVTLTLGGVEFEWRQPTIDNVGKSRDAQADNPDRNFMVQMLIDHSFDPETGELVFSQTDYDDIVAMPFDGEYQTAVETINDALDLKTSDKVKN